MQRRLDGKTLLLVAWSVAMTVSGQLALRQGMRAFSELSGSELIAAALTAPLVWLGVLAYLFSTLSWMVVLSRIDLSVAFPMGSMNYILVTVLSATLLGEQVGWVRWVGLSIILIGILSVARGERRLARSSTNHVAEVETRT